MAERQKHGFIYEKMISVSKNIILSKDYQDKYDGHTLKGFPVQIKCIKHKSCIDLGDIYRNANKKEDFYLIIGFYDKINKGRVPNIVEEYVLFIDHKKWNKLFKFDHYDQMKHLIKTISNDNSDDNKWRKEVSRLKKIWNSIDRYVQPRFKRDHKKQKRVQCAINNKSFHSFFVKEFVWQKTENTI